MNNKGQGLVEFIIIMPVIIYLILGIVDFMLIFNYQNELESKINNTVKLYEEDKDINSYIGDSISYSINKDDKYTYVKLYKDYEFITPGLNLILGNPYKISIERVLLNE